MTLPELLRALDPDVQFIILLVAACICLCAAGAD